MFCKPWEVKYSMQFGHPNPVRKLRRERDGGTSVSAPPARQWGLAVRTFQDRAGLPAGLPTVLRHLEGGRGLAGVGTASYRGSGKAVAPCDAPVPTPRASARNPGSWCPPAKGRLQVSCGLAQAGRARTETSAAHDGVRPKPRPGGRCVPDKAGVRVVGRWWGAVGSRDHGLGAVAAVHVPVGRHRVAVVVEHPGAWAEGGGPQGLAAGGPHWRLPRQRQSAWQCDAQ